MNPDGQGPLITIADSQEHMQAAIAAEAAFRAMCEPQLTPEDRRRHRPRLLLPNTTDPYPTSDIPSLYALALPLGRFAMSELILALDAFMQEHCRCGELDGGVL